MTLNTAKRLHSLFTFTVFSAFLIIFCGMKDAVAELRGSMALGLAVLVCCCCVFMGLGFNLVTWIRLSRRQGLTENVVRFLCDIVCGYSLGIGIFIANQLAPSMVVYRSGILLAAFSTGVAVVLVLLEYASLRYERFKAVATQSPR